MFSGGGMVSVVEWRRVCLVEWRGTFCVEVEYV